MKGKGLKSIKEISPYFFKKYAQITGHAKMFELVDSVSTPAQFIHGMSLIEVKEKKIGGQNYDKT